MLQSIFLFQFAFIRSLSRHSSRRRILSRFLFFVLLCLFAAVPVLTFASLREILFVSIRGFRCVLSPYAFEA